MRIYLREIGRVPLLTAEDEVELAKAIEAGLFADEKLTGGQPCRGARRPELSLLAAEGLRAKQRLIEAASRDRSPAWRHGRAGLPPLSSATPGLDRLRELDLVFGRGSGTRPISRR